MLTKVAIEDMCKAHNLKVSVPGVHHFANDLASQACGLVTDKSKALFVMGVMMAQTPPWKLDIVGARNGLPKQDLISSLWFASYATFGADWKSTTKERDWAKLLKIDDATSPASKETSGNHNLCPTPQSER